MILCYTQDNLSRFRSNALRDNIEELLGDYTKLTETEVGQILDCYDFDELKSFRPLSLGISNSNYEVKTKSHHLLLKVSNDKNASDLVDEQKILAYLNQQNFNFSLVPIKTKKEEDIYHYQDYTGVIYPFVPGIPPGPSDQTCFKIGQGLAKLHLIQVSKNIRDYANVGFEPEKIVEYLKNPNCPKDFKDTFAEVFPDLLENWINKEKPMGLIHGDLYYDNTLFDQNELKYLLDFEQAGRGPLILDIGISISGTCLEKGRIILPLVDSYLEGYQSIRKLSNVENDLLNESILAGLFSISLWRIKRFYEGSLSPELKYSYQELLYKALLFYNRIRQ